MNCTNGWTGSEAGTCATVDYGVTFADGGDGSAAMTGYAWSETVGWVCFGTTCAATLLPGQTTPEGVAPYAEYRAAHTVNGTVHTDEIWGWARVISLGDEGWISLNCANPLPGQPNGNCTYPYYVGVNMAVRGIFNPGLPDPIFNMGSPLHAHFAWSGTDNGTGIGWVDFSGVSTAWAPATLGIIRRPAGVVEPESLGGVCVDDDNCKSEPAGRIKCVAGRCTQPGTHSSDLNIAFDGISAAKNDWLECEVLLPDFSRRVFGETLAGPLSNQGYALTYKIQANDPVEANKLWYIVGCRLAGPAKVTKCGNSQSCRAQGDCDTDCGTGAICVEQNAEYRCHDVIASSQKTRPVYSHSNLWSGLGASEDQYSAIKCNAGFPANYFLNAAQCDFTGDASFALSMRRGIPVEGDCEDGIDNDGNGDIDCADRYCQGVTYQNGLRQCTAPTLPRTTCTLGRTGDLIGPSPGRELLDCRDANIGYDVCCSNQPIAPGSTLSHIVDGLECKVGDPQDGYYDCTCVNSTEFSRSSQDDCFAPGAARGDLCCDTEGEVVKLP